MEVALEPWTKLDARFNALLDLKRKNEKVNITTGILHRKHGLCVYKGIKLLLGESFQWFSIDNGQIKGFLSYPMVTSAAQCKQSLRIYKFYLFSVKNRCYISLGDLRSFLGCSRAAASFNQCNHHDLLKLKLMLMLMPHLMSASRSASMFRIMCQIRLQLLSITHRSTCLRLKQVSQVSIMSKVSTARSRNTSYCR